MQDALPNWMLDIQWEKVNYIINHRSGFKQEDVQNAIWAVTNPGKKRKLSKEAQFLLAEAHEKGAGFVPGKGQIVAIILDTGWGNQMIIFELPIEETTLAIAPALPPPVPAVPPAVVSPTPFFPPIIPPIFPPDNPRPPDNPKPVAEPSTLVLVACGFGVLLKLRKKLR
jgi:hypothetical protein